MINWPIDSGYGDGTGSGGTGTGSGGIGGGGGVGTYDAKNIEFGRMLLAVSEGEIQGLVDGLKSVYLNDTAIQNADDTFNINAVSVALVAGTNDQAVIPGFPDVESEVSVNVEVEYGTPVTRTIATTGLSAVRVRMAVPQLKVISSTDGKESGTSVQFKIERQRTGYNGGAYEEVTLDQSGTIYGKFGSKYTKAFRIELPATGTGSWTIRVTRLTAAAPDAYTLNETWWDSYTELTDARLKYPNTAALAVMVDAKQFQNLPQISTLMDLKIVQVPANYTPATQDPDTGVWTAAVYATTGPGTTGGIWDGTFTPLFTRNPVWQFLDLATNTRYGGGTYLSQSDIDVDTLYALSVLCDEFVDDGLGGSEPRYFCDIYIQSQEEAIKVLDNFASAFRGMLYWAGGKITAVMDQDSDPVTLYTAANVKDGKFTYQGSGRKARHTAAMVTWNDPAAGYRQATEYVESSTGIARYGLNVAKVAGFGISSQGLAQRFGLWTILSDLMAPETVMFTAGMSGAVSRAGDVIQIMDPHRAGLSRFGGRIVSATTTAVTIDSSVTLGAGTYYLKCQMPDGTLESKTVTNAAGAATVITVGSAFSAVPQDVWIIQDGATEVLYRVLSVRESGPLEYEVTALYHDPTKYALVDNGAAVVDAGSPTALAFKPVTALAASETLRIQSDKIIVVLTANWLPPVVATGSPNPIGYIAEASRSYGPWIPMTVNATTAELQNVDLGPYRVRVIALYPNGQSPETLDSYTVLGKAVPPADVTSFVATVQGDVLAATWDAVADVDLDHYIIKEPGAGATDAIKWTAGTAVTGCENLSVTAVALVRPATGSYDYWIKAVDTSGNESLNPTKLTIAVNALDDYVTPTEKRGWKAERDAIVAGQSDLDARAAAVSVSSTTYDTAITDLEAYLDTLTGAQGWSGSDWALYTADYYLGNATPATTGVAFYGKFQDVWEARDALISAILAATGTPFTPTDTFRPAIFWDLGDGSDASFTISGGSAADSSSPYAKASRKLTWSSGALYALSPDFSSSAFTGKQARVVIARVRLNSGTWVGKCHFKGVSPAITVSTANKWNQITTPPVGTWTDVAWDMASLDDSTTDYINNTRIDQIQLELISSAGNIDVDWVAVGTYGAGSKADYDLAVAQAATTAMQLADFTSAGKIIGTKITDGAITSNLVAANAIFAKQLVVANFDNLIPNPNSELDLTSMPSGGWEGIAISSADKRTGSKSRLVSSTTTTITPFIPVAVGDQYLFTSYVKASSSSTVKLVYYAADQTTVIATHTGTAKSGGVWTEQSVLQSTVPASAVYMIARLQGGGTAYFDDMYLRQMAASTLIVDGGVQANNILAGAVRTYHISVGPNYQFVANAGGTPLMLKNDGTFAANNDTGFVENTGDAATYMDDQRIYPAAKTKTFEAHFSGTQARGFLFNMNTAFGSVTTGLRVLHSGTSLTVHKVSGASGRTYSAALTPTTGSTTVSTSGTGKLTAIYSGTSGTSDTRRLVLKLDGAEVATYSDTAIGATYQGQQSGYAGLILGDAGTRPGDVRVWGIALGIGSVTIQDGVVTANTLEADLALVNVIRSTNYSAGSAGVIGTGFKVSGTAFSVTDYDGTSRSIQMEIGSAALLGGEYVGGVINKIKGNSTTYTSGSGTWTCPAGVTKVRLRLIGAGGGGGGGSTGFGGGGGGAGACIERTITVVPGTGYSYSVGAAGTGGAAGANGVDGADTTFGSHTGKGGKKGLVGGTGGAGADAVGSGGSPTVTGAVAEGSISTQQERFDVGWLIPGAGGGTALGTSLASGDGGACDLYSGGTSSAGTGAGSWGGGGAASGFGAGGNGGQHTTPTAGSAGTGYGSGGGGGAYKTTGGATSAGGNGAGGYISIVW